jgi:hypothetical protein
MAMWPSRHSCRPNRRPGSGCRPLRAGAAIEAHLAPVKLNYLTLGNTRPPSAHHIVLRYADDPLPGRPVPFDLLDNGRQPEERLRADALALRALVRSSG